MRLDFLLSQDFAERSLGQPPEAGMPCRRCVLTGMRGEQPSGPQLVRITQFFGLLARQRHQPGFRLSRNDRVASAARPIIQRLDHPQFCRSFKTARHRLARHRLARHSDRARHRIGRRLLQIGQDDPSSFDTARRLHPRPRNLQQTLSLPRISRQRNNSTRRYHGSPQIHPSLLYQILPRSENQTQRIDISESFY